MEKDFFLNTPGVYAHKRARGSKGLKHPKFGILFLRISAPYCVFGGATHINCGFGGSTTRFYALFTRFCLQGFVYRVLFTGVCLQGFVYRVLFTGFCLQGFVYRGCSLLDPVPFYPQKIHFF